MEGGDVFSLYETENDSVAWIVGCNHQPVSCDMLLALLARQTGNIYKDGALRLAIVAADSELMDAQGEWLDPLGYVDLANFEPIHSRAEVGIYVRKAWRGKGIATEAVRQVVDYARDVLHLYQLHATIPVTNLPSRAVFSKIGFEETATLRDWIRTAENYEDAVVVQCQLSK